MGGVLKVRSLALPSSSTFAMIASLTYPTLPPVPWSMGMLNTCLQYNKLTHTRAMWLLFHVLLSTSVVLLAIPAI